MGIFSRTRDIIAANVTDLLDKSQDPAKMIRMIILEMEETLVEVRASAARTIADQKELRRHIDKLNTLEADWTDKAHLALSKDREDLAKAALLERMAASEQELAEAKSEQAAAEAVRAALPDGTHHAGLVQKLVIANEAARELLARNQMQWPSLTMMVRPSTTTSQRQITFTWPIQGSIIRLKFLTPMPKLP